MSEQKVEMPNHAHWPKNTLENLCETISRGKGPKYVESSSVHAIGQRCITGTVFDKSHSRPHDDKAMSGHLIPENGDVLLNSTGTGTIGRSSIFDDHGNFIVDSHVTLLRPRKDTASPIWLNELLRNPRVQRHFESNCYTGSTNQLELSRSQLMKSSVPTPPYSEQMIISSVLRTLDIQIQQTEALIAKLEKIKEGLLHDLLTRGIDENGQLRPSPEQAPELYKESPLGMIPKGWSVHPLKDYTSSEITYGIVQAGPYVDSGVPYIRTGDMSGDDLTVSGLLRTSPSIASQYKRSEVKAGDLVISIRATVGKVLPVTRELDGANLTQGTAKISPASSVDCDYLMWAIRSKEVREAIDLEVKGSTFKEITLAALREVPVAASSSLLEQNQIGKILQDINGVVSRENRALKKLITTKSGLMDDLLTGRVRVTPILEQA